MTTLYKTIADYPSGSGLMPLLYSIRDGIPFAFQGLLLIIFIMLFAGQYYLIKTRTGRAKILIALTSSSFFVLILSLMAALMQIVTYLQVVFYAFVLIVSFILLLLSDES